jgi:hypothetical protein
LRPKIDGRVTRTGKRNDLDVQLMRGRQFEQTGQGFPSILGGQIHEPAAHREHANDRQPLALGPG